MKKHFGYLLVLSAILLASCQKELSFENGNDPSHGSLLDDGTGDCLPKTVNGTYIAATALVATTNTIVLSVNVTKTGTYTIYSDTVNGYYFRATGVFSAVGANQVTIKGNGTPLAAGVNNFLIVYDSTACSVAVTVLPAGTGVATFSLQGTPGPCAGFNVHGAYAVGVALNSSTNTVDIGVNVTALGTYNITTGAAINGMTFSASGTFVATGVQIITLQGSGTPASGGSTPFPLTAGSSNCTFTITVTSPAIGTLAGGPSPGACAPFTIAGVYMINTALTASDTVRVQINVTTAGAYNISTNTVNGFSFAGSGTASTGTQTITLIGSGTPIATGTTTFTVTFGTSTCTFTVNVVPIDYFPRTTNSNWSYEWDDNPVDSFLRVVIPQTLTVAPNTYNIFMPNDGGGLDSTGNYTAGYYRKSAGDYFEYLDINYFIGFDEPPQQWVEYIMLKDNVAASTNWKSNGFSGTVSGTPLTLRFSYTILQKDVPITIVSSTGSVTYQNVIVVEEKYEQQTGPTTWVDVTSLIDFYGKSYYARGVGLIKYEALNAAGTPQDWQELRRSVVY